MFTGDRVYSKMDLHELRESRFRVFPCSGVFREQGFEFFSAKV